MGLFFPMDQEVLALLGVPSCLQILVVPYLQVFLRFQEHRSFQWILVHHVRLFVQVDLGDQSSQVARWALLFLPFLDRHALLGDLEFLYHP